MVLFPPLLEFFFKTFVYKYGKIIFSDQTCWEQFSALQDQGKEFHIFFFFFIFIMRPLTKMNRKFEILTTTDLADKAQQIQAQHQAVT